MTFSESEEFAGDIRKISVFRRRQISSFCIVKKEMVKGETDDIRTIFPGEQEAAVAFSGGTDSAFLLWAAKKYGCEVRAYYVKTAFQPLLNFRTPGDLRESWTYR